MRASKVVINVMMVIVLTVSFLFGSVPGEVQATSTIVYLDNLAPSWTAPGGGSVFSAYIGPPDYGYVSPGSTAIYDGREAGIIKAGLGVDPTSGHYEDEGLFGFIPNITIDVLAAGPFNFDVVNQEGTNPVWMTIEIDTGVVDDRNDNTTYQFVPTTNPAGWHTVDGTTGLWQMWNDLNGDVTGNPLLSLSAVAALHPGSNVVRAYLRLGMGDSYSGTGNGTIGWVDKVVVGSITYDFVLARYWYISPTGSDTNEGTLVSPFLTIQKAIESASSGGTINVTAGTYNQPGGFVVGTPGVIIKLADGVVIQNASPCFVVNADNTTVTAATFGGVKCVPTGGSHGIDVAAGVTNVVIDGIEIDGTGQTTGDGIHFAGGVTGVVIANSYIHNLDGDGVYFFEQPAGVIDIRGNLFMENTGQGIDNTNGTSDIDATYNSWGDYAGPAGTNGDGVTAHVAYDPWTYVELYLMSSGSPWADQVVNGQQITYTVYANLSNATGADFTLNIPAGLTVDSYTAGTTFDVSTVTPGTGTLHFIGYQVGSAGPPEVPASPVTGMNQALFTFTLSSTSPTTYALNLDETTDLFSMEPPTGSSNNVYATALHDGLVTVIDLPTFTSPDIQGYYLTGDAQTFDLNVTNTNGGTFVSSVFYDFTISGAVKTDITSLTCDFAGGSNLIPAFTESGGNLIARVGSGGVGGTGLSLDTSGTSYTCTVTFATAKSYPITINLVDSAPEPDFTLATLTNSMVVYAKPVISSTDMDGPYLVGIPQNFTLTVTDPSGIPEPFDMVFNFPAGTVVRYNAVDYTCPLGVCTIPVTLTAASNPLTFTVTFAAAVNGSFNASLFDSDWAPDRLLAAYSQSLIAYSNYTVTGSFSMQGRVTRAGIPVTLTAAAVPYGPFSGNTINLLSGNFSVLNVPVDTWEVTTAQARYLDVTAALDRVFTLSANKLMAALELKGGDANDNNVINVDDASIVGGQYGSSTPTNGDINFDGKVNIFDLALVGGNYGLTSATAYGTWTP